MNKIQIKSVFALLSTIALAGCNVSGSDYGECIFQNIEKANNKMAAYIIRETCEEIHKPKQPTIKNSSSEIDLFLQGTEDRAK